MILASTVFGMRTVRHISEAMEIVCNAPCLWQENVEPKTKQLQGPCNTVSRLARGHQGLATETHVLTLWSPCIAL